MKDKQLRKAVETLCHTLGISFSVYYSGIEIAKYNNIDGGDSNKQPLNKERLIEHIRNGIKEFERIESDQRKVNLELIARQSALEEYLKIEFIEQEKFYRKIAPKA